MNVIAVNVPGARYDVVVKAGLLAQAGRLLRETISAEAAAIVTDSNVAPLYLADLQRSLSDAGMQVFSIVVPAGEEHKNLGTLDAIYDRLFEQNLERRTPLLALGGGVVGDMGGLAAATALRGVPLVMVPTTLLSMVDSSIGGKTAVNHARRQESHWCVLPATPRPVRSPRSFKPSRTRSFARAGRVHQTRPHRDADGFSRLERDIERAIAFDIPFLTELIAHNVAIKARIVSADPFETGERIHLNFGHTFGHAIEWTSRYAVPHGDAVGLGMVAASYLSTRLNLIPPGVHDRIASVIARAGLATRGIDVPSDLIFEAMAVDKKIVAGRAIRPAPPDRSGRRARRRSRGAGPRRRRCPALRRHWRADALH